MHATTALCSTGLPCDDALTKDPWAEENMGVSTRRYSVLQLLHSWEAPWLPNVRSNEVLLPVYEGQR